MQGLYHSAFTLASDTPRNLMTTAQECDPERDVSIILNLMQNNRKKRVTVCFYGGEPFLAADRMDQVRQLIARSGPAIKCAIWSTPTANCSSRA